MVVREDTARRPRRLVVCVCVFGGGGGGGGGCGGGGEGRGEGGRGEVGPRTIVGCESGGGSAS